MRLRRTRTLPRPSRVCSCLDGFGCRVSCKTLVEGPPDIYTKPLSVTFSPRAVAPPPRGMYTRETRIHVTIRRDQRKASVTGVATFHQRKTEAATITVCDVEGDRREQPCCIMFVHRLRCFSFRSSRARLCQVSFVTHHFAGETYY